MKTRKEWVAELVPLLSNWRTFEVDLVQKLAELERSGDWRGWDPVVPSFKELMEHREHDLRVYGYPFSWYTRTRSLLESIGRSTLLEIGIPAAKVWEQIFDASPVQSREDARKLFVEAVRLEIEQHNNVRPGNSRCVDIARENIPQNYPAKKRDLTAQILDLKREILRLRILLDEMKAQLEVEVRGRTRLEKENVELRKENERLRRTQKRK